MVLAKSPQSNLSCRLIQVTLYSLNFKQCIYSAFKEMHCLNIIIKKYFILQMQQQILQKNKGAGH